MKSLWRQIVRFGFRLLYQELAFTYDTVSYLVSLGQWRCWQRTALSYLPPPDSGIVLELAHGTGNLQLDLLAAGYQTIAYDLSSQMGRIAKAKLTRQYMRTDFIQGDALQLPFTAATFSAIVTTFPTDFIIQSATLQAVHRVLQDQASLVIVLSGIFIKQGVFESSLEWLYSITGQRDADHAQLSPAYFQKYGFDMQTLQAECRDSKVLLLILTKRSTNISST